MEDNKVLLPASTTDPRKPDGQVPPQPPLSSNALLAIENELPAPAINLDYLIKAGQAFYLDQFEINSTQTVGTVLYTWSMLNPFPGFGKPNSPWPLFDFVHSRHYKMDPYLILLPVKIGDTPVFLDIFQNYVETPTTLPPLISRYRGDNAEVEITDSTPIAWKVSNYYPVDTLPTQLEFPTTRDPPILSPRTNITITTKNTYAPTQVHPSSFTVLVFILPRITCKNKTAISSQTGPWALA